AAGPARRLPGGKAAPANFFASVPRGQTDGSSRGLTPLLVSGRRRSLSKCTNRRGHLCPRRSQREAWRRSTSWGGRGQAGGRVACLQCLKGRAERLRPFRGAGPALGVFRHEAEQGTEVEHRAPLSGVVCDRKNLALSGAQTERRGGAGPA